MVAAIGTLAAIGVHQKRSVEGSKILIEGLRAESIGRGDDKLWARWQEAAQTAANIWGKSFEPTREIRFSMVADPDGCSGTAIACASISEQCIYVAKAGDDVDRTTIMLHEIGHLIGVPHIEGDELMDATYKTGTVLNKPSADALAIARAKWAGEPGFAPGPWTVIIEPRPSKPPKPPPRSPAHPTGR